MEQAISLLALLVVLSDLPSAQDPSAAAQTGSICLAPVKDDGDPRGYFSRHFAVRVDGGKWTPVPADAPRLIAGLSLEDTHLVTVRDGNKPTESFRFRFAEFESRSLCLWYKPWYATWSLWDAAHGGRKCRCPGAEPDVQQKKPSEDDFF